jgi:hypothetical protein
MSVDNIKVKDKSHCGLSFNGSSQHAMVVIEKLRSLVDIDEQDFITKFLWALEIECQNQGLLDNEFNPISDSDN